MNARHRKPSMAARITGVAAALLQLAGLVMVIVGGWNATEGSVTNLGIFAMTLAAFCLAIHVVYRRAPAQLAKRRAAEAGQTHAVHTAELPTVPGLTIARDPNVATIKVTPRKRVHHRPESKK